MNQPELIPHLFRTEYSKIVSVLGRLLGMQHIDVAEDIAAETFLTAIETWPYKGIPANPAAWLYTVAKNKAKNLLTRNHIFREKVLPGIQQDEFILAETEIDLSEQNISDSQLQMLFAVCNPIINAESQIGLALRILCGFGIDEIADALLSNKETISKRLSRAKEKLRSEKIAIAFPGPSGIPERLGTVLQTLYLLFSEGYYSESNHTVIREELCVEAMRLTHLLLSNEATNLPQVQALFSLMCFQSSRLEARKTESGQMILYHEQDETLWNQGLITKGVYYLHEASKGNIISQYHIEASIAYWHTIKADTPQKWESILQLYNQLLQIQYSPIAALNRTYAFSKIHGKQAAITEAEKLALVNNHFYFTLLGELYMGIDNSKSHSHLEKALNLAKTKGDKLIIQKKLSR
ncbi:MAG: sigma-70 family RNA polymerase sigma factor [Bacteroidota bacterium]